MTFSLLFIRQLLKDADRDPTNLRNTTSRTEVTVFENRNQTRNIYIILDAFTETWCTQWLAVKWEQITHVVCE